jgi:hypothetical protein
MEKQAGQNSVLSAIRFAACSCVGKHEGRGRSQERTIKRWFGYTHFFPFVGEVIVPGGYLHEPNLWKTKTGDPNFRAAGQTFSPPITRPAPEFSHSLAPLLGGCVLIFLAHSKHITRQNDEADGRKHSGQRIPLKLPIFSLGKYASLLRLTFQFLSSVGARSPWIYTTINIASQPANPFCLSVVGNSPV